MSEYRNPNLNAWLDCVNKLTFRLVNLRNEIDMQHVKELRELEPTLPNDRSAFHLAHNWLVCNERHAGHRMAKRLVNQYHEKINRMYRLKESYSSKMYKKHYLGETV